MRCTSCGRKLCEHQDLCEGCIELAKEGTVVVCVNCGKIARSIKFLDEIKNNRKIVFTPSCKSCNKLIKEVYQMYSTEEKALEQLTNKMN